MTDRKVELAEPEVVTSAQIETIAGECEAALRGLIGALPAIRLAATKTEVVFGRAGISMDKVFLREVPAEFMPLCEAYHRLPHPDDILDVIDPSRK